MNPQMEFFTKEVSYKIMNQNELQMDVIMMVCVNHYQNQEYKVLQRIEENEEEVVKLPSFTVYYVKSNDTLWKIAKRFRVTVERLKEINELKDDLIYPGQMLIIPKYHKVESLSL